MKICAIILNKTLANWIQEHKKANTVPNCVYSKNTKSSIDVAVFLWHQWVLPSFAELQLNKKGSD